MPRVAPLNPVRVGMPEPMQSPVSGKVYLMCLLSKQGFVLRSGVSLSSLNRHLKDGRIKYCRLGSRVLIPESEIQRLADLAAPGGYDAPVIAEPLTAERSEV